MIEDRRRQFWDTLHNTGVQASSRIPTDGVVDLEALLGGKRVLEIGAGRGHVIDRFKPVTAAYVAADISESALKTVEDKVDSTHFIESYSDDFKVKYDTILAFFVFHHVMNDELDEFLGFLIRHSAHGAHWVFNIPQEHWHDPIADGTNTSQYIHEEFREKLESLSLVILEEHSLDGRDNYLMVIKHD